MQLLHVTSPERALKILRSGKYAGETIQGDNGLNTYLLLDGKIAQPANSHIEERGVWMIFEWTGSKQKGLGFVPNIAYDDRPHRYFIPVGTNQDLNLTDLKLESGHFWTEAIGKPSGILEYLSSRICKASWEQSQAKSIEDEVEQLRKYPKKIAIVQRWWSE